MFLFVSCLPSFLVPFFLWCLHAIDVFLEFHVFLIHFCYHCLRISQNSSHFDYRVCHLCNPIITHNENESISQVYCCYILISVDVYVLARILAIAWDKCFSLLHYTMHIEVDLPQNKPNQTTLYNRFAYISYMACYDIVISNICQMLTLLISLYFQDVMQMLVVTTSKAKSSFI